MTRKQPSFSQLVDYVDEGASSREHHIYHNFYGRDADTLKQAFTDNAQQLKRRKNGVYLYHEVISITKVAEHEVSLDKQKAALKDIVRQYIASRAPYNLVYGVLHEDQAENLHYHLVISANEVDEQQPKRLSKAEFAQIKQAIETYTLQRYPELKQTQLMSRGASHASSVQNKDQLSQAGVELKRRTGRAPRRDAIKGILYQVFAVAGSYKQLVQLLDDQGLKLYKRGKHYGVVDEKHNRKHRFATLGLAADFEALDARLGAAQYIQAAPRQRQQADTKHSSKQTHTAQQQKQKQAEANRFTMIKEDVAEEVVQTAAFEAAKQASFSETNTSTTSHDPHQTQVTEEDKTQISYATHTMPDPESTEVVVDVIEASPETMAAKAVVETLTPEEALAAEQAKRLEEMKRFREKKAQIAQEKTQTDEKQR